MENLVKYRGRKNKTAGLFETLVPDERLKQGKTGPRKPRGKVSGPVKNPVKKSPAGSKTGQRRPLTRREKIGRRRLPFFVAKCGKTAIFAENRGKNSASFC